AAGADLKVDFVAIDMGNSDSIRAAAAEVLKRYPRIDILVNAAGWGDIQPYMQNTPEFINRVIAINLAGPAHLTQALLPPMIAANGGKVINIASDAGRVGSGGETVYAGAKGGLIAFTKSLARGRPLLDQRQLRVPGSDRYADARHPLGEAARGLSQGDPVPPLRQAGGNCRRRPFLRQPASRIRHRAGDERERRTDFCRLTHDPEERE